MSLLDTASLIVTPNGYKEGTLYSVIPSDGSGDMSVVRATTATRVNSSGLVELVPYNLLGYSQTFGNAYWTAEAGNTITSDIVTAPDGTLTADRFIATSGNEINVHNSTPLNLLGTFTYSIYLKNNGTNLIEAYLFKVGVGFAARGEINFSAGTFTASVGTGTIENVGNGWFRVSLTNTYTAGTFTTGTFTTSTTGTRSVYAWGSQLVEGTLPKDYQKTETRLNIPRLDYSNGTCPSLLVEPQRTNVLPYSEDFTNVAWSKYGVTISSNSILSPSGIQNADKIVSDNGASTCGIGQFNTISTGTNYTYSTYLKKGEVTWIQLIIVNITVFRVWVNLDNGTIGTNGFSSATLDDVGNGWFKFSAVFNSLGVSTTNYITLANGDNIDSFTGNGTSGVYAWGAQLEAGSYPTSYIPTTSASVTRNADVISKTGISSLIGQTEGTMFVDAYITGKDTSNGSILFATDKVSSGAIMRILYTPTNALRFDVFDGTSFQCQISAGAYNVGDRLKIAGGYKANDFVMYVNGTQIGTDTSGSVPTTDKANINTSIYGDTNGSRINSAILWTTRLTNTQLAQLTTI
jgi:hypothetical protein